MTTSGTASYSATVLELITDALQGIGACDATNTPAAEDVAFAKRKLNHILKQWAANADVAPGLKLWTRRRGYLFLQKGQIQYDISPTGDHATEAYVSTTTTAAATGGATSISVASTAGISSGDKLGIVLDTGAIHWTTQSGAPSGSLTLASGLSSAAAAGAVVFAYATKMRAPFEILSASLRDTSGNDSPIDAHLSAAEYELIFSKSETRETSAIYFEKRSNVMRAFLDGAPRSVTSVVRLLYTSPIETADALTDDVDIPPEWFRPLSAQLSIDIAPAYGRQVSAELKLTRDESLALARNATPEKSAAFFLAEPDCY